MPVPGRAARRDLAVRAAVRAGLVQPLAAFLDLFGISASVEALHRAWPAGVRATHTFAVKANCLVPVLRLLRGHGLGAEVASAGELAQALAAGFGPEELVFDSPAKTRGELGAALAAGIAVNVDNFQELERVDELLRAGPTRSRLGVRVNPQVGTGSIEAMSTAGRHSKFGIALADPGSRDRLVEAYLARPWLRWVHVHVGSQGCPLDLAAAGVAAAVDLAEEVDRRAGEPRIEGIDVGGGLPVDFTGDEDRPTFADHVAALRAGAPRLFGDRSGPPGGAPGPDRSPGAYRVVTEFGRALLAKNGFMAAVVEYTKTAGGRPVAITHAGAHVAARTTFAPQAWPLRVLAYDADGRPKSGAPVPQDVAGPCCFAGDVLAPGCPLPLLVPGDVVAIPDTGAYYFSTPLRYNSLPVPAVYGFEVDDHGEVRFSLLRRAETIADVVAGTLGEPAFAVA